MDSTDPAKTTNAPEQPPAAIIQPGNPAEKPAGMASAEELNMDIDTMLDRSGFAAFLENYGDADSLEMTEENREEIARRFQAFDASKTVARKFETVMNDKLQREGRKDRMNAEEWQAYRDHVAELAARDPDALLKLQEDFRALEENPEKIRQKEAELALLKESWDAEKVKAGIATLMEAKAKVEESLKKVESAEFSRAQKAFFSNFGARFNFGKIAGHIEQKKKLEAELQEMDAAIKTAQTELISKPGEFAKKERMVREVTGKLEDAQRTIFETCDVTKKIRKRLISETRERCEKSLQSMDISTLQKDAEQFAADEKLAEQGSDYFGLDTDPGFAERYKQRLHKQMEKAIAVGIWKALESLPAMATQSRLERALRTFTRLAETESVAEDKEQIREFVLETLCQAAEGARTKSKGSGKSILLKYLIVKLSKAGTATT